MNNKMLRISSIFLKIIRIYFQIILIEMISNSNYRENSRMIDLFKWLTIRKHQKSKWFNQCFLKNNQALNSLVNSLLLAIIQTHIYSQYHRDIKLVQNLYFLNQGKMTHIKWMIMLVSLRANTLSVQSSLVKWLSTMDRSQAEEWIKHRFSLNSNNYKRKKRSI